MNHRLAANLPDYVVITSPRTGDRRRQYGMQRRVPCPTRRLSRRRVLSTLPRMRQLSPRFNARFSRPCNGSLRRGHSIFPPSTSRIQDRCRRYDLAGRPANPILQHSCSGRRSRDFAVPRCGHMDREVWLVQMELGLGRQGPPRCHESGRSRAARGDALLASQSDRADALCRRNRGLATCHGDGLSVRPSCRHSGPNRERQSVPRARTPNSGKLIRGVAP